MKVLTITQEESEPLTFLGTYQCYKKRQKFWHYLDNIGKKTGNFWKC